MDSQLAQTHAFIETIETPKIGADNELDIETIFDVNYIEAEPNLDKYIFNIIELRKELKIQDLTEIERKEHIYLINEIKTHIYNIDNDIDAVISPIIRQIDLIDYNNKWKNIFL
jgi:hypothetical protein